jgi:hypothetical protein
MFYGTPPIVTNGLVLNLDCGNRLSYPTSGTTWTDLSGFANNGTLTNGPTYNPNNLGSIVFDGTDDYVNCGSNSSLSVSSSITLSLWINSLTLFSSQNFPPFIIKGVNVSYMLFGNSLTNKIRIRIGDNNADNVVDSISTISVNTWYNIVGTYDGNDMKIYINGILDNQKNRVGSIPTGSDNVYVGFNPVGEALRYNGRIATTQIYNRALSQAEVLQNYNAYKSRFGLT